MTLWLIATALLILVCGAVAATVTRGRAVNEGTSDSVYADQLKEIDREESAGLIDEADARMARLELQRRLLASNEPGSAPEIKEMNSSDRITLVASLAVIAIGSAVVYAVTGSPDTPSHAMASRASRVVEADLSNLGRSPTSQAQPAAQNPSLGSVDEMIGRLETRLAENPGDVEGWRMLGWSKFKTGDSAGAAAAYAKAVELDPNDSKILSVYGESLILSNGGFVSDTAADALRNAVRLDPGDARARFLLGLKKQQDGDVEGTLDDWVTLLNEAPAGAEWFDDVYARAEELSITSGIDISGKLPPRRAEVAESQAVAASAPSGPAPTAAQIEAADQMSPEDRQAMINGMVEGLQARLEQDPDDIDGWERLIRSRLVLRQEAKARQAYDAATAHFSNDPAALDRLEAALAMPQP